MKTTTRRVTLFFDVNLEFETPKGMDHLIKYLKKEHSKVDMGGANIEFGAFSMKSVEETANVY